MTYLKKIDESWQPIEFPDVHVGEIIDFPGPYEALVRKGIALLVDEDGNELELPGQIFECPVCFKNVTGLQAFVDHVAKHMPKKKEPEVVKEPKKTEETKKTKDDEIRAKRLASLEKARAARAVKK